MNSGYVPDSVYEPDAPWNQPLGEYIEICQWFEGGRHRCTERTHDDLRLCLAHAIEAAQEEAEIAALDVDWAGLQVAQAKLWALEEAEANTYRMVR